MLKFKDWEIVQDFAHECVNDLKTKYNVNVKIKQYTTYDGQKGIFLELYDKYGYFYKEFASGVFNNVDGYKYGLKLCCQYIIKELM